MLMDDEEKRKMKMRRLIDLISSDDDTAPSDLQDCPEENYHHGSPFSGYQAMEGEGNQAAEFPDLVERLGGLFGLVMENRSRLQHAVGQMVGLEPTRDIDAVRTNEPDGYIDQLKTLISDIADEQVEIQCMIERLELMV